MNARVCVDKVLPRQKLKAAADVAITEASRNLPDPVLLGDHIRNASPPLHMDSYLKREALVSLTGKRWQTGRTLRWYFMDGPEWAKRSVMRYARFWTNQANLRFVRTEVQEASEIRVTFTENWGGGSWSYLGTDCQLIPIDEPTMCLGWYLDTDEEDRRRVVLHETGHAISFGHEQAHPEQDISWNLPVVYDYYQRTQGWDRAEVDSQVLFRYSVGATNFSAYDPTSVMHYSVDRSFVTDPSDVVGWNTHRSALDKRYAALWYPKTGRDAAEGSLASLVANLRQVWRG